MKIIHAGNNAHHYQYTITEGKKLRGEGRLYTGEATEYQLGTGDYTVSSLGVELQGMQATAGIKLTPYGPEEYTPTSGLYPNTCVFKYKDKKWVRDSNYPSNCKANYQCRDAKDVNSDHPTGFPYQLMEVPCIPEKIDSKNREEEPLV